MITHQSMMPSAQLPLLPDPGIGPDSDLQARIWALLGTLAPDVGMERRRETRYPFPYLVHLTPVGPDGVTPAGETIVVVGKHVSQHGLGFFHPKPLVHRRMIASLQTDAGRWHAFLVDLSWCRFTRQGWYESGGRFLDIADSPMEQR
jgi:hypothetical protein